MKVKQLPITPKLGNNKAARLIKRNRYLGAHNHVITVDEVPYRIIVQTVGTLLLANAEPLKGPPALVNLFDKSKLATELRQRVESKLY